MLLSFLKLALFQRRRENSADRFTLSPRSRTSLLYKRSIRHPGRLWFGIVCMNRSEVVRMRTFHPLFVMRIKILIHGLDLKRNKHPLKRNWLCSRFPVYRRQSNLTLENNILKVILMVTLIKV